MKGAWTHGAMMTHIRTFVCYFSRLKSLVLPAVGSTKPILRPRIQKPQAMVKHWWNRMGVYLHWEQEAMVIDIFGFTRAKQLTYLGAWKNLENRRFKILNASSEKGLCSRSQRKLQVQPCFSMFFVDITLRAVTAPKWKWCSVSVSAKFANSNKMRLVYTMTNEYLGGRHYPLKQRKYVQTHCHPQVELCFH